MIAGPDDERQQERRDDRSRGAEADVVEQIENDVSLAERREPGDRASALRLVGSARLGRREVYVADPACYNSSAGSAGPRRQRGKNSLKRHATGCLEYDDLVALEACRQPGPSATGSSAVSSRSPSVRRPGPAPERTRRPPRAGPGSRATSSRAISRWSSAEAAPSSRIVPATKTSRRLPRSAAAVRSRRGTTADWRCRSRSRW